MGILLYFDSLNRLKTEKKKKSLKVIFFLLFDSISVQHHDLLVILRRCLYMTGSSIFTFTVLPH